MNLPKKYSRYERNIRVIVTKRLSKKDISTIIRDFINKNMTFAVSEYKSEFELWREILPGDLFKSRKSIHDGSPGAVIETEEKVLNRRDFVCIWNRGMEVFGNFPLRDILNK